MLAKNDQVSLVFLLAPLIFFCRASFLRLFLSLDMTLRSETIASNPNTFLSKSFKFLISRIFVDFRLESKASNVLIKAFNSFLN